MESADCTPLPWPFSAYFFLLVTLAGFWAARWRRPAAGIASLEEWGLAGRSFGTWITWFLIGGDLYTAYTVIAVPAALYGGGAMGFFAVPYAVIAYPYMMLVLPRLWRVCHRHGYITFADFVAGRYGNRWLTVAIAITGVIALMPYIALQLVGMRVVFASMGLHGEWPLAVAFVILAAYTYSSGLRAPAVIAIVKDLMLYIMVLAALIIIPIQLGGYRRVFELASQALATHTPPASIYLKPGQYLGYSTLAIGSALALMLYPHTCYYRTQCKECECRSSQCRDAARIQLSPRPRLPCSVTSHSPLESRPRTPAPLFHCSFSSPSPNGSPASASQPLPSARSFPPPSCRLRPLISLPAIFMGPSFAKRCCRGKRVCNGQDRLLVVKFGALAFVLWLPTPYAIEMQLLGGIWMCQLVPSVVFGVFTRWFHPWALLAGWTAGMTAGTAMAASLSLKSSVYPLHLPAWLGGTYAMYAAVPALLLNLAISGLLTVALRAANINPGTDSTDATAYVG